MTVRLVVELHCDLCHNATDLGVGLQEYKHEAHQRGWGSWGPYDHLCPECARWVKP